MLRGLLCRRLSSVARPVSIIPPLSDPSDVISQVRRARKRLRYIQTRPHAVEHAKLLLDWMVKRHLKPTRGLLYEFLELYAKHGAWDSFDDTFMFMRTADQVFRKQLEQKRKKFGKPRGILVRLPSVYPDSKTYRHMNYLFNKYADDAGDRTTNLLQDLAARNQIMDVRATLAFQKTLCRLPNWRESLPLFRVLTENVLKHTSTLADLGRARAYATLLEEEMQGQSRAGVRRYVSKLSSVVNSACEEIEETVRRKKEEKAEKTASLERSRGRTLWEL